MYFRNNPPTVSQHAPHVDRNVKYIHATKSVDKNYT